MIKIYKPEVVQNGTMSRLTANVELDGVLYPLWIEVAPQYAHVLCTERSDAFVAGLIFYAIKHGEDITFETPMTDQLKDGVEHQFLDVLCQHQPQLHRVKLIGPTATCLPKDHCVIGAGASCGVDCLYTIQRRIDGNPHEKYLIIANMHGDVAGDSLNKGKDRRFAFLKKIAGSLADDLLIPLIVLDTNYNRGAIPDLAFEGCTTYGNLFCVLAIQKLFSQYFIASGGPVEDFGKYIRGGVYGTDCSNYDLLTCQAFSTNSLRFIVDGLVPRDIKVKSLCKYEIAWKHLDVCHLHPEDTTGNCTHRCPKCMYTVMEIMSAGRNQLDHFSLVFDVDYVKSHMHEYAAELLRKRIVGAETAMETWPNRGNIGFTVGDYIKGGWIVFRKIVFKILRGGKTSNHFREN